jgi:anti-anti-sigma factor
MQVTTCMSRPGSGGSPATGQAYGRLVDVEVAPPALWDGHVVLLYRSESEYDANLGAWIRRGLDQGEKVVLTSRPAEPEQRVLRLCADAGVDAAPARRVGQLVSLPPAQCYPPQGQDALIAGAATEGYSGVRLSAQASTALRVLSERDYLAAELAMDENCRSGSFSALCAYARPAAAERPLRETLATHSDGVRAMGFLSARSAGGVGLCGEVDLVTCDVLAAALYAAVGTAVGQELVLDLSELEFIDVAGSRMLLGATADLRANGGRLVLRRLQRPVARALRLLDVDRARGVQIVEEQP